ncbi:MAG TPA: helix-turn-helix domain-containing protein [Candidatus Accumulibacter phosphatis]|nr:MAG: DNA-binding transcriptional regulator Nlp [Candidatus Accumulibacter sp. SK-11]HRL76296.1 helix-turn-helix domain-containing protein [Candidatus Accumulibacter phosphatis]HRQ94892.1 helix-turn-helix domain-containing protein [Candidatus Accumulibacter phosphatis]
MEPADIQCALKKARTSQAEIARKLGVSPTTVTYVVTGKSTSRRIATAIAAATGLTLDVLWPGRYSTPKETA